jgi:hypothetical protein
MAKIALLPSTQYGNSVLGGGTEGQYCNDITRRMVPLLEPWHTAEVFAGQTDANTDGARDAVNWGPDVALSVHCDAGYDHSSHHASLVCYQEESSLRWCRPILETFCREMGFSSRGYQQRKPGTNGVAVLRIPEASGIPACLIETTWMDRNPDAEELRDAAWRQRAAIALVRGIKDFYGNEQTKDGDMAFITSGEAVKDFSVSVNLDVDGDCYCKIYNPGSKAASVRVGATSTNSSKDLTLQPNELVPLSAKGIGGRGETQLFVHADKPVIVTFKQ